LGIWGDNLRDLRETCCVCGGKTVHFLKVKYTTKVKKHDFFRACGEQNNENSKIDLTLLFEL